MPGRIFFFSWWFHIHWTLGSCIQCYLEEKKKYSIHFFVIIVELLSWCNCVTIKILIWNLCHLHFLLKVTFYWNLSQVRVLKRYSTVMGLLKVKAIEVEKSLIITPGMDQIPKNKLLQQSFDSLCLLKSHVSNATHSLLWIYCTSWNLD